MIEKAIIVVNKTQFIKNIKLPSCIECIYYLNKTGKCNKFGEKDVITGKIVYETASRIRYTENLCGLNGNYFEKKLCT
jgi:hypothetical protein